MEVRIAKPDGYTPTSSKLEDIKHGEYFEYNGAVFQKDGAGGPFCRTVSEPISVYHNSFFSGKCVAALTPISITFEYLY